jgi:predicted aldo/keto reductase-like oxidoreductase
MVDKIILVGSDLSGKPVAAGIAKTFGSGSRIKIKNLSEDIVTDYSSLNTELVLKSLNDALERVWDEYGNQVDYFLVTGGACLNIALVANWCAQMGLILNFLVWEKKQGRYIGVSFKGELMDFDDINRQFNYQEPYTGGI